MGSARGPWSCWLPADLGPGRTGGAREAATGGQSGLGCRDEHPFRPTRPVQIELDTEQLARAEAQGVILSRVLHEAVAARLAAPSTPEDLRAWAEAHAAFSKAFIGRYGAWGDEFSTL